jgi:hypothetical protein
LTFDTHSCFQYHLLSVKIFLGLTQQVLNWRQAKKSINEGKREVVLLEEHAGIRSSTQEMHVIPIRRIHASVLTYAEYLRYASRGEPLIIIGEEGSGGKTSKTSGGIIPGVPRWTTERMETACGNTTFTLKRKASLNETMHWARLEPVGNMTITQFFHAMKHPLVNEMSNGYLHDQPLEERCSTLLEDVVIPPWFSQDLMQRTPSNTTNQYWHGFRDYWPSLFIGPGGTTMSYLHADWCDTSAWMGLTSGRKHWRIVRDVMNVLSLYSQ